MVKRFFEESTDQSRAKADIVAKYFTAWAKVIMPSVKRIDGKLAYIDLFAGPGRYEDGTKSTPILVLEKAIADEDLQQRLVTLFNDVDSDNSHSLEKAIKELPGIKKLKYQPKFDSQEVGQEIVKKFQEMAFVPTLFFVDPWGYKGLSLGLVNSVLKDWGCDCIFFFNYNRINMGLDNPAFKEHMDVLFGPDRAEALRDRLSSMCPPERELAIIEEIAQAIKEMGGRYVLPFRFRNEEGTRTSHHLIFASKHFKGYEIMKNIMAGESTTVAQGVPSFEYSPADKRNLLLFDLSRPLDALESMLMKDFAGQTLTVGEIYLRHNVDKPYISKNYKSVLKQLEAKGKVTIVPSGSERPTRKGELTLGDGVMVTFPSRRR